MFVAWNERRQRDTVQLFDAGVVLDARGLPQPDFSGVYRGLEEYGRWTITWLSAWEHITQAPVWIRAREDRVVAWVRIDAVGKHSGIGGDGYGGWDFTFRNGVVTHIRLILDEADAIDAIDAPPPAVGQAVTGP
jgi:hypothetical protein